MKHCAVCGKPLESGYVRLVDQECLDAQADGRVVVLPCKAGKEVFAVDEYKNRVERGHFVGMFGHLYLVGLGMEEIENDHKLPAIMFCDAIHYTQEAAEAALGAKHDSLNPPDAVQTC